MISFWWFKIFLKKINFLKKILKSNFKKIQNMFSGPEFDVISENQRKNLIKNHLSAERSDKSKETLIGGTN